MQSFCLLTTFTFASPFVWLLAAIRCKSTVIVNHSQSLFRDSKAIPKTTSNTEEPLMKLHPEDVQGWNCFTLHPVPFVLYIYMYTSPTHINHWPKTAPASKMTFWWLLRCPLTKWNLTKTLGFLFCLSHSFVLSRCCWPCCLCCHCCCVKVNIFGVAYLLMRFKQICSGLD